jgi:hypothetical protein
LSVEIVREVLRDEHDLVIKPKGFVSPIKERSAMRKFAHDQLLST